MTYNAIGYIIFLGTIFFITFRVGWMFYKNGEVFLKMLLSEDDHLVESINKLLLVGYYLLNFGYASISISEWPEIFSGGDLLYVLSQNCGTIIIMLALMHYFNLLWLLLYSRHINKKNRIRKLFENEY